MPHHHRALFKVQADTRVEPPILRWLGTLLTLKESKAMGFKPTVVRCKWFKFNDLNYSATNVPEKNCLTLYSIDTRFYCSRQHLKTSWQKKKLLLQSNFFLCHNVFKAFQLKDIYLAHFLIKYFCWKNSLKQMKLYLNMSNLTCKTHKLAALKNNRHLTLANS